MQFGFKKKEKKKINSASSNCIDELIVYETISEWSSYHKRRLLIFIRHWLLLGDSDS